MFASVELRATHRLTLRPYTESDADDYAELQTNPNIVKYITNWPLRDKEDSLDHLETRRLHQNQLRKTGDFLAFAVEHRTLGKLIGDVSMLLVNDDPLSVELGWIINEDWQGLGFATEAVSEMINFCVENGITEFSAEIHEDNAASIALANKLGIPIKWVKNA